MSDLISRQDAIKAFYNPENGGTYSEFDDGSEWYMTSKQIYAVLESLPSADRPTGEWEIETDTDEYGLKRPKLVCSKCKKEPAAWDLTELFEFCPNCGAKMRGEEE